MVRFPEAERVLFELGDLHEVLDLFGSKAETHVLARLSHGDTEFPIHGVVVGAKRADAPTLALIGGVHGLARALDAHPRPPVVIAISRGATVGLMWLARRIGRDHARAEFRLVSRSRGSMHFGRGSRRPGFA